MAIADMQGDGKRQKVNVFFKYKIFEDGLGYYRVVR